MIIDTHNIKRICAFLLATTFMLPLSRCNMSATSEILSSLEIPSSTGEINTNHEEKDNLKTSHSYTYAFKEINSQNRYTWLIPLAFFWPQPFVLWRRDSKLNKVTATLGVVEGCNPPNAHAPANIGITFHGAGFPPIHGGNDDMPHCFVSSFRQGSRNPETMDGKAGTFYRSRISISGRRVTPVNQTQNQLELTPNFWG